MKAKKKIIVCTNNGTLVNPKMKEHCDTCFNLMSLKKIKQSKIIQSQTRTLYCSTGVSIQSRVIETHYRIAISRNKQNFVK